MPKNREKRDFDKVAASWDEKPARVRLVGDIAAAMVRQVPITSAMDALDFGCGTGLLTLRLQPLVGSITGVDSSQGMLDIFNAKVADLELAHVGSQHCDLDKGEILTGTYDLVVSNMTLHHIKEIEPLLRQFYTVMAPGGFLCLSDLDLEGGRFHGDNTGVFHFGFDRSALRTLLVDAGFVDITDMTAAEMEKPDSEGVVQRFSVFLLTARKQGEAKPY